MSETKVGESAAFHHTLKIANKEGSAVYCKFPEYFTDSSWDVFVACLDRLLKGTYCIGNMGKGDVVEVRKPKERPAVMIVDMSKYKAETQDKRKARIIAMIAKNGKGAMSRAIACTSFIATRKDLCDVANEIKKATGMLNESMMQFSDPREGLKWGLSRATAIWAELDEKEALASKNASSRLFLR